MTTLAAFENGWAAPLETAVRPVPFSQVTLAAESFWGRREATNREVTLPHNFHQCDVTGRLANFDKAARKATGYYEGLRFNDSDVYKVIEGAARVLRMKPDPKLDAFLDSLIARIASAQQPDGYLYTVMTAPKDPARPVKGIAPERWVYEQESHELYCAGHLYEAAAMHFEATGKRNLLDVALKNAALIAREFGPGKRQTPSGHQEIELGLVRLHQVTGRPEHLELATFFLEARGRAPDGRKLWGEYYQDHVPVREQEEAVGHAVRAAYQYMAMADVAVLTGNTEYVRVLDQLWQNVAQKKLYLTGGVGGGNVEGFSAEYALPNIDSYNETCSSIANALWNHRMFLLHGHGRYIDVLERSLYNSFLSGVGFSGDLFFYPNKLATGEGVNRSPWFSCACCPTNVVRFVPQIAGFMYATRAGEVLVNLYAAGTAQIDLGTARVRLTQETDYPWSGRVRLQIAPDAPADFTLRVRIPGWLREPFPSTLYRYADSLPSPTVSLKVNGAAVSPDAIDGYVPLKRRWQSGDVVELDLPMPVRRVVSDPKVQANLGRVALMRGPLVYSAEGVDNADHVHSLVVPDHAELRAEHRADLLGGVTALTGPVRRIDYASPDRKTSAAPHPLVAIPYFAWAHRGKSPQRVWLAREDRAAWPTPARTPAATAKVSASAINLRMQLSAVNDQILPRSSTDREIPAFGWRPIAPSGADSGTDTTHWIQYTFAAPVELSATSIYWHLDRRVGYQLPKSYRVLARDRQSWKPVIPVAPPAAADTLNHLEFPAVTTTAIRLEVTSAPGEWPGLLEWSVQ